MWMLAYSRVQVRYGGFTALNDVSLTIAAGELVALFGHNGAGKTTLLRCALGDVEEMEGHVAFLGETVTTGAVAANARRGIGFVQQGHNVFRDLSVLQNLNVAGLMHDPGHVTEIYRLFPILAERRSQLASSLSGGQQQMLALGMALMTQPRMLLLDEPATGLAPVIVQGMLRNLTEINRSTGTAIVIAEQNVAATLKVADRAVVLKSGRVIFDGRSSDLSSHEDLWSWF
jgi:branched-chain amino acid transport system ATP-binding protein